MITYTSVPEVEGEQERVIEIRRDQYDATLNAIMPKGWKCVGSSKVDADHIALKLRRSERR
jgi:hypothetical protein